MKGAKGGKAPRQQCSDCGADSPGHYFACWQCKARFRKQKGGKHASKGKGLGKDSRADSGQNNSQYAQTFGHNSPQFWCNGQLSHQVLSSEHGPLSPFKATEADADFAKDLDAMAYNMKPADFFTKASQYGIGVHAFVSPQSTLPPTTRRAHAENFLNTHQPIQEKVLGRIAGLQERLHHLQALHAQNAQRLGDAARYKAEIEEKLRSDRPNRLPLIARS